MITAAIAFTLAAIAPTPNIRVERLVEEAWSQAEKDDQRHQDDLKRDTEIGKKYSEVVDKELKISDNTDQIERVKRIGDEMAAIANQTHAVATWGDRRMNPFTYTFKVVKDKDINAFSLPGGYIYVYDGLISAVESDDELAGVLSHEIAHAAFRHVATLQREQSKLQAVQIPLLLLAIIAGGANAAGDALTLSSLIGTAVGSGWSVKAEQSADYGGLQYMMKSKYDPTGLLTFMERMVREEKRNGASGDPGIFRTHPPSAERAAAITSEMKSFNLPVRRSRVSPSCRVEVKPHEDGTVAISYLGKPIVALAGPEALDRADKYAVRINAFFDAEPDMYEVSSTQDGDIIGKRQMLIELDHEDAVANKTTVAQLASDTTKNLKWSVANLSFRIWAFK